MKPARAFTLRYVVHGQEKSVRLLVDDQDAHLLRSFHWGVHRDVRGNRTVYRNAAGGVWLSLGQAILQPGEDSVVWHFNGDDADFRRENLRVSTRSDRARQIQPAAQASRLANA